MLMIFFCFVLFCFSIAIIVVVFIMSVRVIFSRSDQYFASEYLPLQ
jgi:hypothetical protein